MCSSYSQKVQAYAQALLNAMVLRARTQNSLAEPFLIVDMESFANEAFASANLEPADQSLCTDAYFRLTDRGYIENMPQRKRWRVLRPELADG